jgi:hypothetical protein
MKERPILFNGAMVRALLDGSKTQTRRAFSTRMIDLMYVAARAGEVSYFVEQGFMEPNDASYVLDFCPFGQVGDQLWVRETFQPVFAAGREHGENTPDWGTGEGYDVKYPATDEIIEWIDGDDNITSRCKPSIHMPRWASRIQLEITGVRVERLQDISEEDAKAEGVMQLDADGFERPMDRDKDGWKLCPVCAGTGLHSTLGANGGVICDVDCIHCNTHKKLFMHLWHSTGGNWGNNPYVWAIDFKQVAK